MKDNFNLKAYLKEHQTMENANPYLAESNAEDEFRNKVREMVIKELSTDPEAIEDLDETKKEEEEVEDIETTDVDLDAPAEDAGNEDIMGHLKSAFDLADDEKLKTQIGNTITMYTKTMY